MPAYKGASSSDIMQAATDNVAAKYHPWQGGVENTKPNVIPGPNGLIFILNPETGHYDLKTHQVDANGNHLLGQDADTYALRNMHGGLGLPYTEGGGRDMRTPQQRTDDKNADLMMNQFLSQDAAKRLSMNWAERRANVSGTVDNDQVIRDKDTYAFLADKAWTEWAKANDENPADAAGDDKVRFGIRSGVSIGLDDKNRDHFMAQVMPNTFDDEKTVAKKIASLKFMFDSVKSLRTGQPLSPETDTLPKIWDRVDATYAHKAITGNREQTEWTPWSLKAPPIKQQTEEKKAEAAKKALAKERARITEEQNRPKPNEGSEGSR